jgi:paraquat-inducible protein B
VLWCFLKHPVGVQEMLARPQPASTFDHRRKQRHHEAAADLELVTQQLYTTQQQLHKAHEDLHAHDQQTDVAAQQAAATTNQLQQQLEAAEQKLQHKQRFWAQDMQRVEQHWQQQLQVLTREQDAKVMVLEPGTCCSWPANWGCEAQAAAAQHAQQLR